MTTPDSSLPAGATALVHLVRHGEVQNPDGVLYGRIPGYHLSETGRLMAKAAADFLAGRDVTVVRSSPLERALETAEPIAAEFGLDIEIDDRLIEPWNHFEGMRFGVGDGALRRPGTGCTCGIRSGRRGGSPPGRWPRASSLPPPTRPGRPKVTRRSASVISSPSGSPGGRSRASGNGTTRAAASAPSAA